MNLSFQQSGSGSDKTEITTSIDVGNSPFVTVKDYQKKISNLSNENLNLKLQLYEIQKEFRTFLKSMKINDDIINTLSNQQKIIAQLTSETEDNYEYSKALSLKRQLKDAIEDNLKLTNELKKQEKQKYDDVVESSALFDDGAQANIDNLELKTKVNDLLQENEKLNVTVNDLNSKVQKYKSKNQSLIEKITDLKKMYKNAQSLKEELDLANSQKDSLKKKTEMLEKQLEHKQSEFDISDAQNAVSQLEEFSEKNSHLLQENLKLKQDNQFLEQERENKEKLIKQLNSANEMTNKLKNTINSLENANSELMNALCVLDFDDILPKFDQINKEKSDLQTLNKQFTNQISQLNAEVSNLKTQIYQLQNDNNKLLISQNIQSQESKVNEYDVLTSRNYNLKQKKRTLRSSIQRLNTGNNSYIASTSFSPKPKIESSIANIDSLLSIAKKENEKLTKKVDELHDELIQKLYAKIAAISEKLLKYRFVQKERDELQQENNLLQEKYTQIQNDKLIIQQKFDLAIGEKEDLFNEINDLKKQQRVIVTPRQTSYTKNNDIDSSLIDNLRKQVNILEMQNNNLKQNKSVELEVLKTENQRMLQDQIQMTPVKFENGNLKKENEKLKSELFKEVSMRTTLLHNMNEIFHIVDDKINSFIDNFEDYFNGLISSIQRLYSLLLSLSKAVINENRSQFHSFFVFSHEIICDLNKGAIQCIQNCKDISFKYPRSLISRDDRKTLTKLQNKWKTYVAGDLAQFIIEENEKSMLNIKNPGNSFLSNSSFIANKYNNNNNIHQTNMKGTLNTSAIDQEYVDQIRDQLQKLIHAIWTKFGIEQTEPTVSPPHKWKINDQLIIQNVINLFDTNVSNMKNQIDEQKQQIEIVKSMKSNSIPLSHQVVDLLTKVRKDISKFSTQMHTEHQELIITAGKQTM
ncbi:hypothetical protein M9Y10_025439 [Tritrichomonas musculus]|uniref:Uncharacterized protein n=1 Tax=Tritrichomonas musculus TaxID=1915356 RepID=A0ABR2H9H8_9EUKA